VEIAIVGSGLSAWAVFQSLSARVSSQDSITIIDSGYRFSVDTSDKGLLAGQKKQFGSAHMYDTKGSGLDFSEQSNYSMANGGLSTVWGAGIRLWSIDSLSGIPVKSDDFYAASKFLLERLPYTGTARTLNIPVEFDIAEHSPPAGSDHFNFLFNDGGYSNIKVFPTPLAVDVLGSTKCRGCGGCLTGCPYNSIFDAGIAFDSIVRAKKLSRIAGVVWRLVPLGSKVQVDFDDEADRPVQRIYDTVYLCAGAIGSPAILMRSDLISHQIDVLDSQVFYFIGIQWPRREKDSKEFALSQATISAESGPGIEFTASLYESNEDVRNRISDLVAKKLFGLRFRPLQFLDHFLFFGIGFLDSSASGKIRLSLEEDSRVKARSIGDPGTVSKVRQALRQIAKSLLRKGLLVIPWISVVPQPGAGFHSGAALPLGSALVDSKGCLRTHPSIHISDTSLLPYLKPGAHTFTSMSLSSSLILGD
jgi:ferredoxin